MRKKSLKQKRLGNHVGFKKQALRLYSEKRGSNPWEKLSGLFRYFPPALLTKILFP